MALSDAEELSQSMHTLLLWSVTLPVTVVTSQEISQLGKKKKNKRAVLYESCRMHSVGLAEYSNNTACIG